VDRPVALVTGGAHGIGAAIAARLARDGFHVVVADTRPGPHVQCDVSDEAAVNELIGGIGPRLDALVCNAGISANKPIAELSLVEWSRVIGTNLTSTFLLVRAAEPLLRAAHGSAVTIASTRAHMSEPDTEAYAASKGGLVALTHALAISLAPDVRVNCISPGPFPSAKYLERDAQFHGRLQAKNPMHRTGNPAELQGPLLFLASDASSYVTGVNLAVDGGWTAW